MICGADNDIYYFFIDKNAITQKTGIFFKVM